MSRRTTKTTDITSATSDYVSNFDHMPYVLAGKNLQGKVFAIDGDSKHGEETLLRMIELMKNSEIGSVRIAVLFRCDGHTTPFCIEKRIIANATSAATSDNSASSLEINSSFNSSAIGSSLNSSSAEATSAQASPTNDFQVIVYHTDSVIMDIDAGDRIKTVVKKIAQIAETYSLGFDDPEKRILANFKRQSDTGSCATFALHDAEVLLEHDDFYDFVIRNSDNVDVHTSHTIMHYLHI